MENLEKAGLTELSQIEMMIEGSGFIFDAFYIVGSAVKSTLNWASTQTLHHSGEAPKMH
jgi:hypothetical protein